MFNSTILKKEIKASWLLWLILMILPAIFVILTVEIAVNNIKEPMPTAQIYTPLQMMIFGSIGFELPLIFLVINANRLVCGPIQNGAMTFIAASPVKRSKIIGTKLSVYIGAVIIGFILNLVLTVPFVALNESKIDISVGVYMLMLFGLFLLLFAIGGISFIFSTYFNKLSLSYICGAGIPILFFIFYTLSEIETDLSFFKYLSVNSLYDYAKIAVNTSKIAHIDNYKTIANFSSYGPHYIVLFLLGAGLYTGSGFIFVKKDLPL